MYRLRKLKNYLVIALAVATSIVCVAPLVSILYTALVEGGRVLLESGLRFLTDLPPTPLSPTGGIAPALVGSLVASTLALLIAVPPSFLLAYFVTEFPKHLISKVCEVVVRSFMGVPSIVISMFVYYILVVPMGTQSVLAGSVALSIVALPYAYVYFTSAFRSIPTSIREAAMALGLDRVRALIHVYVGLLRRPLTTGLLVTYLRVFGDTAPLLFTMGFLTGTVFAGLLQPGNALPLLIFIYALSPYEVFHRVAWGATLVLLLIYLTLFTITRSLVRGVKV
jgi:phosphate transport system permease protein